MTMNLAVSWLCIAIWLSCNVLVQSEISTLYPTDPQNWSLFPYGTGDVELTDEDDYSWFVHDIGRNVTFFGTSYDVIRVSIGLRCVFYKHELQIIISCGLCSVLNLQHITLLLLTL